MKKGLLILVVGICVVTAGWFLLARKSSAPVGSAAIELLGSGRGQASGQRDGNTKSSVSIETSDQKVEGSRQAIAPTAPKGNRLIQVHDADSGNLLEAAKVTVLSRIDLSIDALRPGVFPMPAPQAEDYLKISAEGFTPKVLAYAEWNAEFARAQEGDYLVSLVRSGSLRIEVRDPDGVAVGLTDFQFRPAAAHTSWTEQVPLGWPALKDRWAMEMIPAYMRGDKSQLGNLATSDWAPGYTDEFGRLDITGLPAGELVSVSSQGALLQLAGEVVWRESVELVVSSKADAAPVSLTLSRALGLSGRVLDDKGVGLQGLSVVATHPARAQKLTATTSVDGSFLIQTAWVGDLTIGVEGFPKSFTAFHATGTDRVVPPIQLTQSPNIKGRLVCQAHPHGLELGCLPIRAKAIDEFGSEPELGFVVSGSGDFALVSPADRVRLVFEGVGLVPGNDFEAFADVGSDDVIVPVSHSALSLRVEVVNRDEFDGPIYAQFFAKHDCSSQVGLTWSDYEERSTYLAVLKPLLDRYQADSIPEGCFGVMLETRDAGGAWLPHVCTQTGGSIAVESVRVGFANLELIAPVEADSADFKGDLFFAYTGIGHGFRGEMRKQRLRILSSSEILQSQVQIYPGPVRFFDRMQGLIAGEPKEGFANVGDRLVVPMLPFEGGASETIAVRLIDDQGAIMSDIPLRLMSIEESAPFRDTFQMLSRSSRSSVTNQKGLASFPAPIGCSYEARIGPFGESGAYAFIELDSLEVNPIVVSLPSSVSSISLEDMPEDAVDGWLRIDSGLTQLRYTVWMDRSLEVLSIPGPPRFLSGSYPKQGFGHQNPEGRLGSFSVGSH